MIVIILFLLIVLLLYVLDFMRVAKEILIKRIDRGVFLDDININ